MNYFLAQKAAHGVPAEVIQKINFFGAARAVRAAARASTRPVRNFAQGARVGFRESYSVARAGRRDTLNIIADRAGLAGVRAGISAGVASGRTVRALAPRIAAARARGARIGNHLRLGYHGARQSNSTSLALALRPSRIQAVRVGDVAGVLHNRAENAVRTWVRNARVAGGGFWRRTPR